MSEVRRLVLKRIKFYEKISRKTRRSALRKFDSEASDWGIYQDQLKTADGYEDLAVGLMNWLQSYDDARGL